MQYHYLILPLCLIVFISCGMWVSFHVHKRERALRAAHQARSERANELALQCTPQYQTWHSSIRAHELATGKLTLEERKFTHEQYKFYAEQQQAQQRVEMERQQTLHTLDLEQRKFALDQQKLEMERSRLLLEAWKAQNFLDVGQHGAYRINSDGSVTAIPPLTRLAPGKVVEQAQTSQHLPAPYDMREVWATGFRPSPSGIWLAKSATSDIIVPWNKLLHSIACGPTGGGKTSIIRTLMACLIYIGCHPILMDIHYAPIKEDEGGNPIDWRPLVARLARPPIFELGKIVSWMQWCAYTELEARISRQRDGHPIGAPIFFHIAELPATLGDAGDELAEPLAKILRQGRQYRIYFFGDSQDLLTSTLKMTSGPRECFRTGFYTGGDPKTAKVLLDIPNGETISEEGLGIQGQVYVKTAMHPYTLARVGWMSNEALYELFETPLHERIGASDVHQTFWTPDAERVEPDFSARPDAQIVEADSSETEGSEEMPANVRTFPQPPRVQPVAPTDATSGERLKYRLNDTETTAFIAAYKASGNIDKALQAAGRGASYRDHARELVRVHNLKKDA